MHLVHACVYVYVCGGVFFFFWQQGLPLAWSSLIWLDRLAIEAQDPPASAFPGL